jgi:hypothetical protein
MYYEAGRMKLSSDRGDLFFCRCFPPDWTHPILSLDVSGQSKGRGPASPSATRDELAIVTNAKSLWLAKHFAYLRILKNIEKFILTNIPHIGFRDVHTHAGGDVPLGLDGQSVPPRPATTVDNRHFLLESPDHRVVSSPRNVGFDKPSPVLLHAKLIRIFILVSDIFVLTVISSFS